VEISLPGHKIAWLLRPVLIRKPSSGACTTAGADAGLFALKSQIMNGWIIPGIPSAVLMPWVPAVPALPGRQALR
jgi:hypothetical protein